MANLLRMDLYRMFKSKMFWICIAIIITMVAFEVGALWFSTSDAYRDAQAAASSGGVTFGVTSNTGEALSAEDLSVLTSMSQMQLVAQVALSIVPLLLVLITTVFCASEFENGFTKNIFSMKPGRLKYFSSKAIVMLIITLVLLAVGTVVTVAAASIAGLDLASSAPGDWAIWGALAVLILMAYELLASALFWLTRSKVAALIISILAVTGLFGTLISGALNIFFPAQNFAQYLLSSSFTALNMQGGTFEGVNIALVAGVALAYAIVGIVVGAVSIKKKDV